MCISEPTGRTPSAIRVFQQNKAWLASRHQGSIVLQFQCSSVFWFWLSLAAASTWTFVEEIEESEDTMPERQNRIVFIANHTAATPNNNIKTHIGTTTHQST